jgi:hypothetical protein
MAVALAGWRGRRWRAGKCLGLGSALLELLLLFLELFDRANEQQGLGGGELRAVELGWVQLGQEDATEVVVLSSARHHIHSRVARVDAEGDDQSWHSTAGHDVSHSKQLSRDQELVGDEEVRTKLVKASVFREDTLRTRFELEALGIADGDEAGGWVVFHLLFLALLLFLFDGDVVLCSVGMNEERVSLSMPCAHHSL